MALVEREVADSTALSRPRLDALREAARRGEVERIIVLVQDRLGRGADIIAVMLYLLEASGLTADCVLTVEVSNPPESVVGRDRDVEALQGLVLRPRNIGRSACEPDVDRVECIENRLDQFSAAEEPVHGDAVVERLPAFRLVFRTAGDEKWARSH